MKQTAFFIPYYIRNIFVVLLFLPAFNLYAQFTDGNTEAQPSIKDKMFFGGGFGLQFGNSTLIDISPIVGYKITPRFGVGIGASYKYYRIKNFNGVNSPLTINVGGGSLFARYMIIENIFAHAEYEKLIYKTKSVTSGTDINAYTSFLVGGGYRQMMSERASMNFMVLWNLNDTPDSPYTNPIIRIGFSVGF